MKKEHVHIIDKALGEGRTILSEHESKQVLSAFGIPVTREIPIWEKKELRHALRKIGFPLVMKGSSPHIAHKTERGLVRIDIRGEREAEEAFAGIMEAMGKENGAVLVQEMIKGERELVVGLVRDPQFGPCVMFGLGGIFTEVLKDVSYRVAPLERWEALEMMMEIRGAGILEGVRTLPEADKEALTEIFMAVGRIGVEEKRIREIDINPLILKGSQPIAVDALIVLEEGALI